MLKNFGWLCDCVTSGVENEKEHAMLMNFARQHVDIQHRRGLTSKTQLNELNNHL